MDSFSLKERGDWTIKNSVCRRGGERKEERMKGVNRRVMGYVF